MIIGFNKQFPIIATAYDEGERKYPIVHVLIRFNPDNDVARRCYLEFEYLANFATDADKVEEFRDELMKLIADETNINLPYKIGEEFFWFSNKHTVPGKKYALLPAF